MRDEQENFSIGMVERAVLKYLYEDGEGGVGHTHYEIIRVDEFELHNSAGVIFIATVKELFTLPQQREKAHTRLGVLLASFQEDGSLKISAPAMSTHLASL